MAAENLYGEKASTGGTVLLFLALINAEDVNIFLTLHLLPCSLLSVPCSPSHRCLRRPGISPVPLSRLSALLSDDWGKLQL